MLQLLTMQRALTELVSNCRKGSRRSIMTQSTPTSSFFFDYWRDAIERSVLFLDILRQRGNIYLAQSSRTAPHVLNFEAEVLVDGRTLGKPVNYALVRIIPPADVTIDPTKRPFIVFDPRAGHGPGIGGMKHDSEIGVVLHAGHPCYFVGFLPHPEPGQTIADVCRAEAHFVEVVAERHKDADGKPALIGNCQAGWQIMMMAAQSPDLAGPIIIAGTPLSYWAGVRGKNPMRYLGGMLGGTWLTSLTSDLGDGIFDGAWLISNFESNNPANTFWQKPYNVYAKVDTEGPRYLEFEKWWGCPVLLNGEEIQFIVDELFVGNRLTAGKIVMNGKPVNLRNIKSPIIVFCSFGDDITPPQQALDWILDIYKDVDDLIASGQTIIYSLHPSVGHLGIFVSGKVAKKEHEEFVFNIDLIDVMPPGLYEIVLKGVDPSSANPQLVSGEYIAKLEPRTFDDIRALGCNDAADERRFETMARLSETNGRLYREFLQPVIQTLSTPATAEFLREIHPNRVMFRVFSDRNALMRPVAQAAEKIRAGRHPVEPNNPFLTFEKIASSWIVTNLEIFAKWRETMTEATFLTVYGMPWLQTSIGLKAATTETLPARLPAPQAPPQLEAGMYRGGPIEAGLRALLYIQAGEGADERQFNALEALRSQMPEVQRVTLQQLKETVREQAALLRKDPNKAVASITKLLPEDPEQRARLLTVIHDVAAAEGNFTVDQEDRFDSIRRAFGLAGENKLALSGPFPTKVA
jgi:pimeloyl-ACP methyl ester carboxylesterase